MPSLESELDAVAAETAFSGAVRVDQGDEILVDRFALHLARWRRSGGRGQAVHPRRRAAGRERAHHRRQARHGAPPGLPCHHVQGLGLERSRCRRARGPGWPVHGLRRCLRPGRQRDRRTATVRVDRTIRSLGWARASFVPRAGGRDRLTVVLRRRATVSVGIYQGSHLVARSGGAGRSPPGGTGGRGRAGRLPGHSSSRARTASWSTRRAGSAPRGPAAPSPSRHRSRPREPTRLGVHDSTPARRRSSRLRPRPRTGSDCPCPPTTKPRTSAR